MASRSTLNRGDFVALVGRSGCGKSTLLNLGGAMDFPTTGQVLLDGISTSELNENGLTRLRREKVGFIFQSFQLLNTLTVLENVELPLLLAGETNTRDRALRQLDLVELGDLDSRMPHQLSGGQMQRVAIARAMVHAPRLAAGRRAYRQPGYANRRPDPSSAAPHCRRAGRQRS